MALQFKVIANAQAWIKRTREAHRAVAIASVVALRETATNAVEEGRADIASAGAFGANWQRDLRRKIVGATEGGEASLQAKAIIFHKSALAGVFEHGISIQGKPLLWIPTTPGAPRAGRSGKKLTSATVRGQPMLFDAADRDRKRKPLYIGVPAVRIAKKWHIIEIVKQHTAQLGALFLKHFKDK
jgi:hypothetical protein